MTTLIIFDWDDTLFPTSHMNKQKYIDGRSLRELDLAIYTLLSRSLHNGRVYIITNATLSWVNSVSRQLPLTRSLLGISVSLVSARDDYSWYIDDINKWKVLAFEDLVRSQWNVKKVLSIGDDKYEYLALRGLNNRLNNGLSSSLNNGDNELILKSIRTTLKPSVQKMITQIRSIDSRMDSLCSSNKHMDLYI